MRLSNAQIGLLRIMAAGVTPTLRPGPASTVILPEPHARRWRLNHGGMPVQSSTLQALLSRELISRFGSGHTWVYRLTKAGRAAACEPAL